jgi:hypothetical protein
MNEKQIKIEVEKQAYALSMVMLQHDQEQFGMLCVSGQTGRQYFLSPAHAKRVYLLLEQHLKDFEAKHGEIKTELPKNKPQTKEEKRVGF